MRRSTAVGALCAALALSMNGVAAAHDLDGAATGHLVGTGEFGAVELVGTEQVTSTPDLVADVAVSPDGRWAYLANWGEPDCAGPETGGQTSPDAGAWVVSLADLTQPETVGFIPSSQDTRPGEGMQVLDVTTSRYTGTVLVMNNEQCGKNGRGGISLWDVSNPRRPRKLSEHFGDRSGGVQGDTNPTHSAFAWDAGDRAYVAVQDSAEFPDVDILDITNPRRPRLIAEYDLNDYDVAQPDLDLTDADLHDLVVEQVDGRWILLASYWDGGFVALDVTVPTQAEFLGDTDYPAVDAALEEATGTVLTPEGNAHQAEFTADDRYIIGTDEDFGPYRADRFRITSGPNAAAYPSVIVPGAQAPAALDDLTLDGPVVYGGYGCPDSAAIPRPESIPGYLDLLQDGDEKIVVLQRGPSGDPSAPEAACFPGEKANAAVLAGWDAVVFVQRHDAVEDPPFCGSGAFVDPVVGVCTSHAALHGMFDSAPLTGPWTYPDGPAIGDVGERVEVGSLFDGWGYVRLYDASDLENLRELDTYAIPEAHDEAERYTLSSGDLTVHEVATSQLDPSIAYFAYYAGGFRVTEIQGEGADAKLVEIGGYLGPDGNDIWGVEVFTRGGVEYVAASDRDFGLLIFTLRD